MFKRNYSQHILLYKWSAMLQVYGHKVSYFDKQKRKGNKCYSENEVISMLEFLIDNMFVEVGGYIFFSKSSASLCEQPVPLSLLIFSYTPMRLGLYKNLSKTNQ